MIITEPKWKSWIVETTTPLFTPEQCQMIIDCGHKHKLEWESQAVEQIQINE